MKKNKTDGQFSTHNAQRKTWHNNALLTFFNRTCVCVISYGSPYEKKDTGERTKKTDVKRSGNRKIDEKVQKAGQFSAHSAQRKTWRNNALSTFLNRTRVCIISYGS